MDTSLDTLGPYNILMVSDFFYPNTGGVETHIYQLSQCLMALGHKVVILTHSYGDIQGIHYLTNGLKVYYLPRLPIYQQASFPTIFGAFPPLRRIILQEKINIVHAHQAFSTMAHEAVLHARTMGCRVVFTDHSLFGFADASSILVNKVLKFSLADVHAAICVSHTSKENTVLRACIPPQRVYVIPNAVEASLFKPLVGNDSGEVKMWSSTTERKVMAHSGRSSEESITVIAMSRLVYRKGIDLLAAVLPELCRRYQKLKFIIGGDGPKKHLLEEIIHSEGLDSRVTLIGEVQHDHVRQLLIQGQIFLNCSLTEAFCVSLVEAAAAGLLVVSTRVGGVPEVLPPEMLVLADPSPEGVLSAIDTAVERVLNSPVDVSHQHEEVTKMYSWHAMAQRTARVYDSVIQLDRDDSMAARLGRYWKCGKWFGKICCCVVAADWWYLKWLELWESAGKFIDNEKVENFKLFSSRQNLKSN
ncbi:hypothetical protein Ndes2526B_g05523 [Nannochloris sp. 'desiccata']|nr:hypothetical protein KSW81_007384 [Chlorella desiccata (nom. nud.)]KAH7618611.1 putative Phosphatidylinositol N-acetylglucosaminyltransferase subunit A [Chlorella desiccata (nom. nud.)]